jgi:tetratricopeptide (TPR) repeat protein
MGVVYKARQIGLNRLVALKMILHARHVGAAGRKLFQGEAEAVAQLQHPHIVQIHEIGTHEGQPYFSLEYCPGGNLEAKLDGKPLPAREGAALVQTLALAVETAHQKGIVHRDLKPANVLLTEDGVVKVTDFGLAKRLDQTGDTWNGAIMGSPNYMAPEQAAGRTEAIGPATDVYALGAILYECLTGRPPFLAASAWEVLEQVRSQEPVPPRRLQPQTPADLETICLKCLEKEPGKRYASAQELADDLIRFLSGEPIRARPVPTWERVVKLAWRKPTVAALVAALVLAVLAASVGGLFFGLYKEQQNAALRRKARIDELLAEGRDAHAAGNLALERRQEDKAGALFAEADRSLERALTMLEAEIETDTERIARTRARRKRVQHELEELARRQRLRPRLAQLRQDRHDVLFHEISPTGRDKKGNLEQVTQLARAALLRFGVTIRRTPTEEVRALERECGRFTSKAELKEVAAGCYEVLLAWAEAEAETGMLPPWSVNRQRQSARQALRILDTASALAREYGVMPPQAYYLRRSRYHARAGEQKEAALAKRRAAGLRPRTALDHFLAGLEHYRQEKFDQAARECGLAQLAQPGHFWAQYLQALCQVKTRRWAEAQVGFTACLWHRPDFLWARLLRGTVHAEMKEFKDAEIDFATALKQAAGDRLGQYVALTNRSVLWTRQKQWNKAIADLEKAIRLRPGDFQAHANMAEVCRSRSDLKGAVLALDRAVASRPDDAILYFTRALDHLAMKDTAAARRDLLQTIALTPRESDPERLARTYVELGMLKHRARELKAALDDFNEALRLQPNYPRANRQRAETLLLLNDLHEAGGALDAYLQHGKPDAKVYLARGVIHTRLKEYLAAVDAYSRSLALAWDVDGLIQRGWVYLQLESPRLAFADFDAAVNLQPRNASALCGRGHARVLLGQAIEAVADGEESLRLKGGQEQEFLVACLCMRASRYLSTAKTRPERRHALLATRYEDRAAQLVCQALERMPENERAATWRRFAQPEPTFVPLRRHPQVLRLVPSLRE